MNILGIIPARYRSNRLPGKSLLDIGGKPMIQRVYEQSVQCKALTKLVVATDDRRIFEKVSSFGGEALMTSDKHRNGTERCSEVVQILNGQWDVIINIQGDEPFIQPNQIQKLAECFIDPGVDIATMVKKIEDPTELEDTSTVKVSFDNNQKAIKFSRSAIITNQKDDNGKPDIVPDHFKHVAIYGFKHEIFEQVKVLEPTPMEKAESLEQLRWLENGFTITIVETDYDSFSIDTEEDYKKALKLFEQAS